jgi:hypothetical protein
VGPAGLAFDHGGNLYIADLGAYNIRRVDGGTGIITTAAGTAGVAGFAGDGGPATAATLLDPTMCTFDPAGNIYIADLLRVRRVDAGTGLISTVAGNGGTAFSGDGVQAVSSAIGYITGVAVDASGNLFAASLSSNRILRIDASTGLVATVAGNGNNVSAGDGGLATSASLHFPQWVTLLANGNLIVSEGNRVRRVYLPSPYLYTTTALSSSTTPGTVTLSATVAPIPTPSGTPGATPTGSVQFYDSYSTLLGTATLANGSASLPLTTLSLGNHNITAAYSGDGVYSSSTSLSEVVAGSPARTAVVVTLSAGLNPVQINASNPYTVQVTPTGSSNNTPTGSVTLLDGNVVLATAGLSNGSAQIPIGLTTSGVHSLSASYSGDNNFASGTSGVLSESVKLSPALAVSSGTNPATVGTPLTFTATLLQAATGTVQFVEYPTPASSPVPFGSATAANGSAVFTTSSLSAGMHNIAAIYSGDGTYIGTTSSYFVQTINQIPTTTSFGVSVIQNPAAQNVPTNVLVSVIAGATTSLQPSGAVQLFDGNNLVGTGSLSNGYVVLPVTFGTLGNHSLTAVYAGDSNFAGSTSSAFTESVKLNAVAIVTSSMNPAAAGASVTFTATVPQGATGSIQFMEFVPAKAAVAIWAVSNISNGVATASISSLSAGTHQIGVTYAGDSNYIGSNSAVIVQTINQNGSVVTLTSTLNPATPNQSFNVNAQVAPATSGTSLQPSGTVQLLDGSTVIASSALTNGAAAFPVALSTLGVHSLTASYSGDTNFSAATSAVLSEPVKSPASLSLSSSANPSVSGTPFTLTATVLQPTATGTIQFVDYAVPASPVTLGTVALSGSSASLAISNLPAGTHAIGANYSGDTNFVSTGSSLLSQLVKAASATALSADVPSPVYGQVVHFTASVNPATATGSVQFLDGATVLGTATLSGGTAVLTAASLSAGAHSVSAIYPGDGSNGGSTSATVAVSVGKAASSVISASSSNPAPPGGSVTLTATVSPNSATGTMQFLDGSAILGTVAVSAGSASFTASGLAPGSHSIASVYSGDANFNSSTSAALIQVVKGASTVTLTSSAGTITYGQSVQFMASLSPGASTGSVQFLDGSTLLGTVTLSSGTAVLAVPGLAVGSHSVTASYSGDGVYNASASAAIAETVNKAVVSVTETASANPVTAGAAVTFTAAVAPAGATGSVQFKDGSAVLATVNLSAGAAAFTTSSLAAGSHSITAAYSGDTNYASAASSAVTETVNTPVPASPSNLTATATSSSQINLSWTASTTSGVTYNVYSSTVSGFTPSASNRIASGLSATSYSNSGLSPATAHYYVVTSQNAGGESGASNQATATTQASGVACHVVYSVTTQWNVGFGTAISIQNTGTQAINGWNLTWAWAGNQAITQAWNANYTQSGANASLTNASWNAAIGAGATISGMGFNGSYSGANTAPTAFYLNGQLCH